MSYLAAIVGAGAKRVYVVPRQRMRNAQRTRLNIASLLQIHVRPSLFSSGSKVTRGFIARKAGTKIETTLHIESRYAQRSRGGGTVVINIGSYTSLRHVLPVQCACAASCPYSVAQ